MAGLAGLAGLAQIGLAQISLPQISLAQIGLWYILLVHVCRLSALVIRFYSLIWGRTRDRWSRGIHGRRVR